MPRCSDAEIDAYVAATSRPQPPRTRRRPGRSYQFVDTAGRTPALRQARAKATPIVFIHGFGGDLDNWLFNIDALAAGSDRSIALDLPGHGQSTKTIAEPDAARRSPRFRRVPGALGIENAHLVGHSMGGAVAAQMALRRPGVVKSLDADRHRGARAEINTDYIEGFVAAESRRDLKPVLEHLFADPDLVSRQMVDDLLKYKRLDGVSEALKKLSSSLFADGRQQAQLGDALSRVTIPTMIIWGEDDEIIPAKHAAALTGQARTHLIGGTGHMVQMEAANTVNALLKEHIRAGRL